MLQLVVYSVADSGVTLLALCPIVSERLGLRQVDMELLNGRTENDQDYGSLVGYSAIGVDGHASWTLFPGPYGERSPKSKVPKPQGFWPCPKVLG